MKFLLAVLAAAATACSAGASVSRDARTSNLTIEQLIDIKHPSSPIWSPDGRHVAFLWDRAGVTNIYVADPGASSAPRQLTGFLLGQMNGAFWSHDGQWVYFPHRGDLWKVSVGGGEPQPVWTTPAQEAGITPSPDGTRVAFVRSAGGPGMTNGADLWVRSLSDARETHVAHDAHSIFGVSWSPDASHLAYAGGSQAIRHEQTPEYSGAKIIYTITERTPGQTYVVAASGGRPVAVGTPGGFGGVRWVDAHHVVYERTSTDFKRRTTYLADIDGGTPAVVREDVDQKFWSIPGDAEPSAQPSPDGKWLAFVSDRDGWDELYVMPAAKSGGKPVEITKGRFEAWRPSWSPDSTRIAFDANEPDHPGDRHLGIATIGSDPAHATVTTITSGRGTDIAPRWSPDGRRLVYQHTDPHNSADLFVIDASAGAKPSRLSDSMPSAIDRSAFVEPEFVHYPGPDGQQVPGWLFVPKNLDRTKKHPAIVWIHGDGINQNYDGWHVQRNYAVYYSFHQYLLQQGYVVFAPDYRGSIGYGRDWRQGVYMDVGGKDAKDAWMSANYLKTLPYVDPDRIGVWGLSYGGFFTLIAVTDQPTLFRAAVDVAGVADYAMYYDDPYHGSWTASRIGTPEQNPKVYAQASPVSHIDRLQRPLLILHGTADVNVPFLHSVRLIDEALKKGKGGLISFMVYPGEFHYFTRGHVLEDAWHRVDTFFRTQLEPGRSSD
ncbi:MAG: prolyl oligopeptidase family serine peptidase [Betaproteobacteria bacterium]